MSVTLYINYAALNSPTSKEENLYNKQYMYVLNSHIDEYFKRYNIPPFPQVYDSFFQAKPQIMNLSSQLPTIRFIFHLPSTYWLVIQNGNKKYYPTCAHVFE